MSINLHDVGILGAGVAGLVAALAFAEQDRRVVLFEPDPPSPASSHLEFPERVVALSQHSLDFLGRFIDRIEDFSAPYRSMTVVDGWTHQRFSCEAMALGRTALGRIVDLDALRWQLWKAASQIEHISAAPSSLLSDEKGMSVLANGVEHRSRLWVGADGARSWLRERLGIAYRRHDYAQKAFVCALSLSKPHEFVAWQRFLSTGPIALLPCADLYVAHLVWSVSETAIPSAWNDVQAFELALMKATEGEFGVIRTLTLPKAFPLSCACAKTFVQNQAVLLGEAAHVIHPLAGQGLNLSLSDVESLVEHFKGRWSREVEWPRMLRDWNRRRVFSAKCWLQLMTLINRCFLTNVLGDVRRLGFWGLNRFGVIKQCVMKIAGSV